jgi:hypothetical protein
MACRLRPGKAYGYTILGMLTLEHFDVYQPVVDDQGIDGVIRVRDRDAGPARYYELQIKGSKTWGGIRCKVKRLTKRGVLICYCAAERKLLWFLYEELPKYFPAKNENWGDVFLKSDSVSEFKLHGRDRLDELLKRL